jgi:thiamine biosynthesis lipoprotein
MPRSGLRVVLAVILGVACRRDDPPDAVAFEVAPAPAPASETAEAHDPPVREDGTILGEIVQDDNRITITLYLDQGRTPREAGEAMQGAFNELARIEEELSEWTPGSGLSRLNASAGGPAVRVGPELLAVLLRSREVSEATQGLFDPTFKAVGRLWRFEPGATPPAREEIAAQLAFVGWRKVEIDPAAGTVRLPEKGMMLGLGGIATGFAVDAAAKVLVARGFSNFIIEGTGDTFVSGTKGGAAWKVGIQEPNHRGMIGHIPARDEAITTSGDYERFFEHEGERYAHILDPRTGWPVPRENGLKSVTIVAPDATLADGMATALFVLGPTEGMALIEARPDLGAVMVTDDDEILVSSDLVGRFVPR